MKRKGCSDEYERVLERSDLQELRRSLKSAEKFLTNQKPIANDQDVDIMEQLKEGLGDGLRDEPDDHSFDCFYDHDDPETLLAVSVLAATEFDHPRLIGFIAAGPLEDIFRVATRKFDPALVDELLVRIEDQARKSARFRWMLSGVWTYSFNAEHAERIKKAVAGVDMDRDPLPPRPDT